VQFTYNINTAEVLSTTTGSGAVTYVQPFAVCSTGAAASSSAMISTLDNIHYQTGQGLSILLTAIFTPGVAGSTQLAGAGNAQDGLFFGYNGGTFGINRRYNGVDNWVAQSAWNVDPFNGSGPSGITLDPTKGNVFKIQFQWLGFGAINFYVENPVLGALVLVHRIQYPNANTTVSLLQPSFPIMIQASNTSNTSNISIRSPSMAALAEGKTSLGTGLNFSFNSSKNLTTTVSAIFTIRNDTTFAGITNRKTIIPIFLNLTAVGITQIFEIFQNTTLGGTPAYTAIAANQSCASADIAGTTVTGGRQLFSCTVAPAFSQVIDLSALDLQINNGDTFTITGQNASGGAQTGFAALNWVERY
jgi:hypothetical protein